MDTEANKVSECETRVVLSDLNHLNFFQHPPILSAPFSIDLLIFLLRLTNRHCRNLFLRQFIYCNKPAFFFVYST